MIEDFLDINYWEKFNIKSYHNMNRVLKFYKNIGMSLLGGTRLPLNRFLNNLRGTGSSIQCTVCRPCRILPELLRFFALVCHENRRMVEEFDAVCAIHCNR